VAPRIVEIIRIFSSIWRTFTAGTTIAAVGFMAPRRRAHHAAIAAASDGSVLINVVGQLPEAVVHELSKRLGPGRLFIGMPLSEGDATNVVARLDGAAAEAAAHLLGGRAKKRPKARRKAAAKHR
jgi:hypothetical protein